MPGKVLFEPKAPESGATNINRTDSNSDKDLKHNPLGDFKEEFDTHFEINQYITEERPFYKVPHFRKLAFYIFLVTLTSTTNGFDGSLLNGLQSTRFWSPAMGYPTGHKLGALSNGTIFGSIVAFPFCPMVCDRYGRKLTIYFGQSLVIIGSILQGASTNFAFFFVSRFVLGFGCAFATIASPSLISEIAFPTHRDVSTFSYNICWYLGAVFASIVTYLTKSIDSNYSWKIPSYLQCFFPALQFAFFHWVPESPRFLIAHGKFENARAVLSKHHIGDDPDANKQALVDFEVKEIEASLEVEKLAGANSNYKDFWQRKTYRKRLFLVIFTGIIMQLSGNGLVSYYLNKVLNSIGFTDLDQQLQINMCLMIYNFVVCVVVCFNSSRFRRRTLFLVSLVGMCTTYVIWTVLSAINQKKNFEDKSLGQGVLAMIFLYYLAYNIGCNGLPFLYITEILPYSHRAKGINIFQLTMYIVLIYNGFVNPIAMDAIEWKYYIVFVCIVFVETIIVYFFYPETSGRTLEEVAEVFGDGDQTNMAAGFTVDEKRSSLEHREHA